MSARNFIVLEDLMPKHHSTFARLNPCCRISVCSQSGAQTMFGHLNTVGILVVPATYFQGASLSTQMAGSLAANWSFLYHASSLSTCDVAASSAFCVCESSLTPGMSEAFSEAAFSVAARCASAFENGPWSDLQDLP